MASNFLPTLEPDSDNCKLHNNYDIQSCVLAGISVLLGTAVCFYGEKLTEERQGDFEGSFLRNSANTRGQKE